MKDDAVDRNLQGMDDLDFVGWNNADWTGVFAHHHTAGSERRLPRDLSQSP